MTGAMHFPAGSYWIAWRPSDGEIIATGRVGEPVPAPQPDPLLARFEIHWSGLTIGAESETT